MNVLKMAWRNVWRNRRRTVVNVVAMTFSLCVLLLYSGMIEGYVCSMEVDLVEVELGDLQVYPRGYLDNPSLHTRLSDTEALVTQIDQLGLRASPRLLAGGLVARGRSSAGIRLVGLDVERDQGVSLVYQRVERGQWLDPIDLPGVVIGRGLARVLEAQVGDELVVVSQAADGSIANDLFQVRGVLDVVGSGADHSTVFMNAAAFRELMVLPSGAHQILVRRPLGTDLSDVAASVRALSGSASVYTWRDLMPVPAMMIDQARSMVFVVFGLVYVAVGILLLNAMLMAVFERIREFGVLKAVGMGPGWVLGMILAEGAVQMGLAVVIGLLVSLPMMVYLAIVGVDVGALGGASVVGVPVRPVWHAVFTPATVAGPIATLVAVVFVAVLYPALRAAWIRPVVAMSHL